MKSKSPWSDAHIALKLMWDERIAPTGMSQEEFGEKYGIGTQGMVSQYLLGARPLNYDAAAKFARGFNCSIEEISPGMARAIFKDILPVLRRSLRRRRRGFAVLAWLAPMLAIAVAPQSADASIEHNQNYASKIHIVGNRIIAWLRSLLRSRTSAFA